MSDEANDKPLNLVTAGSKAISQRSTNLVHRGLLSLIKNENRYSLPTIQIPECGESFNRITIVTYLEETPVIKQYYENYGEMSCCFFDAITCETMPGGRFGDTITPFRIFIPACSKETLPILKLFLQEGALIWVTGKLSVTEYENRNGDRHSVLEVTAHEIINLDWYLPDACQTLCPLSNCVIWQNETKNL